MIRSILIIGVVLTITSCGGCNTSTAEGAVDCICDITSEAEAAVATGDILRMTEISEEMDALKEEIDGHIEAGDYTENEMEAALASSDCDI